MSRCFDQPFNLQTPFTPAGDQPQAIEALTAGLRRGVRHQTLLGVTGSGKTFTIANVIAQCNRPTVILAHNKTLAAQLYCEMKTFFPNNAVEYFVSYYDYYQPEAYIPSSDTFIEKDSAINAQIDQLRLSATKALLERRDVIVVASVSAIYGLGDPGVYHKMTLTLRAGEAVDQRVLLRTLISLQYKRNQVTLQRGQFRLKGEVLDICPADRDQQIVRLEFSDERLERLTLLDSLTGECLETLSEYKLCPKTHYVTTEALIKKAIESVRRELAMCRKNFLLEHKLLEEQRITQRTLLDLEMLSELGYCNGIENYSRYLSGRNAGDPPPTLLEYLPEESLLIVDESHVMIPQLKAMYHGDRMRKQNLVQYGFRLPSAYDNRPLTFEEFEQTRSPVIFLSATPSRYEYAKCGEHVVEQVIRPTGLLDPVIEIRPVTDQLPDLLSEIHLRVAASARVFVTTLTKRMAEDLTRYLVDHGIRARYLHSEIDTIERIEILKDLRQGVFDVLVGINLLREGLDLPEVSLVAILDADKEGFLRSESALIQTMGRAARHLEGKAILYADKITPAIAAAMSKTQARRQLQAEYNAKHQITPAPIKKEMLRSLQAPVELPDLPSTPQARAQRIVALQAQMRQHASQLEFERAKQLRDEIKRLHAAS